MMQQVATTKSEVAAFASGSESSSGENAGANEQFGKLLYDQQSVQSADKKPQAGPTPTVTQSTNKPEGQISKKAEDKSVDTVVIQNNETNQAVTDTVAEESPNQRNTISNSDNPALREESAKQSAQHEKAANTQTADIDSGLDVVQHNADFESNASILSETSPEEVLGDSDPVVPQHWVTLVDNLQKLNRDTEVSSNETSVQFPVTSKEELRLPNQMTDKSVTIDPQTTAAKVVDVLSLETQLADEVIAIAMEKAVADVSKSAEFPMQADSVKQKTLEILLDDPEQLQTLVNISDSDVKTFNTDVLIGEEQSAVQSDAPEKSELDELVDLTLSENHSLLQVLLSEEASIEEQSAVSTVVSQNNEIKLSSDASKEAFSSQAALVAEDLSPETLDQQIMSAQSELLAKEPELVAPVPKSASEIKQSPVTENSKAMVSLINMPESKLDKVLDNIAQRITDTSNSVAVNPLVNEQNVQQLVNAKASDMAALVDSTNKEVVAQLKTGLEEFKSQLAQGREPGIDLKALVSEAAVKASDKGALVTTTVNPEQLVKTVSRVMDFATSLNQTLDQHQEQTYSAISRDASQIQAEQSKQSQLNLFESKFEKAINITKPEGHQQLAEKVRWMVNTKNLIADIRLDPADLGSVHVKVAVSGESASVNFVVQSQQARDAMDTATPRLREMLAEKGIELGQSSVRQENGGQQEQGDTQSNGGQLASDQHKADEEENIEPEVTVQQNIVNGALGGVDYFV